MNRHSRFVQCVFVLSILSLLSSIKLAAAEPATEFRHFRFTGSYFYLYRSTSSMQLGNASLYNAYPPSTTLGDVMNIDGFSGTASYFFVPQLGISLTGGIGSGALLGVELEIVPTSLGTHLFDFALLDGFSTFAAFNNSVTLFRLHVGARFSVNLDQRWGVSTTLRFAPFFSTHSNASFASFDLFSLGDMIMGELGVFFRI